MKALRESEGLSQADFAEFIGTTLKTVQRWEETPKRGRKWDFPRGEQLIAISRRTRVSIGWLLGLIGTDDAVWRADVKAPTATLVELLEQHLRSVTTQKVEEGVFDSLGPVRPDRRKLFLQNWPIDAKRILHAIVERELDELREWIEWHNSELMLRMLTADLRRSLEALAPRLEVASSNLGDDEITAEFNVAAGALKGLVFIADEMLEAKKPAIRPPRIIDFPTRTPTTARNPTEVLEAHRNWLDEHTLGEAKGWPNRRREKKVARQRKKSASPAFRDNVQG